MTDNTFNNYLLGELLYEVTKNELIAACGDADPYCEFNLCANDYGINTIWINVREGRIECDNEPQVDTDVERMMVIYLALMKTIKDIKEQ